MDTSTLELQLWIIIALFIAVLMGQIICAFMNKSRKDVKGTFAVLWDTGEFDELIDLSKTTLRKQPNNINALYFGAKALHVRGRLEEAKDYFERLIESEPTLQHTLQNELDILERDLTDSQSPKPSQ